MALQISYTSEYGVTHAAAYAKIVGAWIDLVNSTIAVSVQIWTNADAKVKNKRIILNENIKLNITPNDLGVTPSVALYTDLKTTGRYTFATDV